MSWQQYINSSLVGSGYIDKGAIISAAGDSVWAGSPGWELKPAELATIAAIVKGDDTVKDRAVAEGLYVGGERYVVTRAEDGNIYAQSGRVGVTIAKTKQAIVLGRHPETAVVAKANSTVEALAEYLTRQGY